MNANTIEISSLKSLALSFRRVNYPQRKHYILQVGRTEARIIMGRDQSRPFRSFAALTFAVLMYHSS